MGTRGVVELRVDFCSHEAAKYAVEKWHYSRTVPAGKRIFLGVWEGEKFVGAVIFGLGANRNLGKRYGLGNFERCELTRVALADHRVHPTSRVVAISLRLLSRHSPNIRAVFSYADTGQGHIGTIYQAGGWIYLGKSQAQSEGFIDGQRVHKRTVSARFGTIVGIEKIPSSRKHLYALAFTPGMRATIGSFGLKYPTRGDTIQESSARSIGNDAARFHRDEDAVRRSARSKIGG